MGLETSDDAGVVKLRDDLALVVTVDIITPVLDDPYIFGQIAAANSVSDVFSMGGTPVTAVNICCFPGEIPKDVLAEILRGGRDKVREAGGEVVGGHTVKDEELKFGCSVTGTVHPDRVIRNRGAKPGDALVLTKPIGTGVLISGCRKGKLDTSVLLRAAEVMTALNDKAGTLLADFDAHAATDVTGFGLAGHGFEMAKASGDITLRMFLSRVPHFPESLDMIAQGIGTSMTKGNRAALGENLAIDPGVTPEQAGLTWDPQTSGGLLVALEPDKAEAYVARLKDEGVGAATIIGEVVRSDAPGIELRL